MKPTLPILLLTAALVGSSQSQAANWFDRIFGPSASKDKAGPAATGLSSDQVSLGLKEALRKGVETAVQTLGKTNGFLNDLQVRVPMPQALQSVESGLRKLGQDRLADEFVVTLNRAAEKAVPEAAAVLVDSVQQMTLADATAILTGTNNAATQYFRRTSETNLYTRFYPIVQKSTGEVGLTSAYKKMVGRASFVTSLLGPEVGDLDGYVTQKALDGLFVKIAEEEKRIRENPAARTSQLLETVFGALKK